MYQYRTDMYEGMIAETIPITVEGEYVVVEL